MTMPGPSVRMSNTKNAPWPVAAVFLTVMFLDPGSKELGPRSIPGLREFSRLWPPSIVNPDAVAPNSNDIWGRSPWSGAIVIALSVPVHVP